MSQRDIETMRRLAEQEPFLTERERANLRLLEILWEQSVARRKAQVNPWVDPYDPD